MIIRRACLSLVAMTLGCASGGDDSGARDLAVAPKSYGYGLIYIDELPSLKSVSGRTAGVLGADFAVSSTPWPTSAQPPPDPCATRTVAGCTVRTCDAMDLGAPPMDLATSPMDLSPPPYVFEGANAGDFTITGGKVPIQLTWSEMSGYSYAGPASNLDDLWHGGETLTATATGLDVPPFTVSLDAPANVNFTAPTGPVTLTSGQDLQLPTTSIAVAMISVSFWFTDPATPTTNVSVSCELTPSGSTVIVPGAALAVAPKGVPLMLEAFTRASSTIDIAGWRIVFDAANTAIFPGDVTSITVTLQ